jgi:uncharacterized protein DUF5989
MLAVRGVLGTLQELMSFLWGRRLWWLIPVVIVLLIFSVLTVLSSTAGIGPFIYTLF